jgi:prepilin-type N-terminal cleavage/methylation domain-containing protein
MRPVRRGVSLVEVAVALALGGVVASVVASVVARQVRAASDAVARADRSRIAGDAVDALAAARAAAWTPPVPLGDTALGFVATVAGSLVCRAAGDTVWLAAGDPPHAVWRAVGDSGDRVVAWDTAGAGWTQREVRRVASAVADCVPWSARGSEPATRVVLGPGPPVAAGVPARVLRRVRWVVYRAGDGSWQLGERRCAWLTGVCGPVTPVAGPLAHGVLP